MSKKSKKIDRLLRYVDSIDRLPLQKRVMLLFLELAIFHKHHKDFDNHRECSVIHTIHFHRIYTFFCNDTNLLHHHHKYQIRSHREKSFIHLINKRIMLLVAGVPVLVKMNSCPFYYYRII